MLLHLKIVRHAPFLTKTLTVTRHTVSPFVDRMVKGALLCVRAVSSLLSTDANVEVARNVRTRLNPPQSFL